MPSTEQWLTLVSAIWLQTINGPNSDFPVYSSQLKDILSISQLKLNNLAFASDAGKLFGCFSGVAAAFLPLWVVLLTGASLGLVGYGVQFLFLANKIAGLSYWKVFLLNILAGNGICWINTVCYLLCIRNFGDDYSRFAVGVSTSYVGLSAKVYDVLSDAVFHLPPGRQAKAYLLLNAVVPTIVSVVVLPLLCQAELREVHVDKSEGSWFFLVLFTITVATGVCAVTSSIGSVSTGRSSSKKHLVSFMILLASPLIVPAAKMARQGVAVKTLGKSKDAVINQKRVHDLGEQELEDGNNNFIAKKEVLTNQVVQKVDDALDDEKEVSAGKMIKTVEFWFYFFGYMSGATLGLVFLNNLGQIAESRGLHKTSYLVSLSSSFGFFGRLLPSLVDFYLSKNGRRVSGPATMAALMASMGGAFFLLLHQTSFSLYVGTAVIGGCTGAITTVAVSTTTELFGSKHFGVNHNIVVLNIPLGSFVFGFLAALLYEKGDGGGSKSCMGHACYDTSYVVWGCLCSLGTLLCCVLHLRTSRKSGRGDGSNFYGRQHELTKSIST